MASNEAAGIPWLTVKDASLRFGRVQALNRLNFLVCPGEFHAVVGNHNEGKSTLCRILSGMQAADTGELFIDGSPQNPFNLFVSASNGIEYMSDAADVFPHMSGYENITIGDYRNNRKPRAKFFDKDSLKTMADKYGLRASLAKPVSEFPVEDRLLIKLLGCLYNSPRLLILDETLEQFPPERFYQVVSEIKKYVDLGLSVVWATHRLEDVLDFADRISILRNGKCFLSLEAGGIDRRKLARLAYSSTRDFPGDSKEEIENYYNLVHYSEVVLQNLPSAVLIVNQSGEVQFINTIARKMFSLEANYRQGMDCKDIFLPANERVYDLMRRGMDLLERQRIEGLNFSSAGGNRIVDIQVLPTRNELDRIAVMLVVDDVSERENMRRQLVVSHNLSSIGLLAAGVAHEVNNPLESIGNYISYLLRRCEDKETEDILNRIKNETTQIHDITTKLSSMSGKGGRGSQEVDLVEMCRDLVHMLEFNAEIGKIEIECSFPDHCPAVLINQSEARQVFLNIIRNSLEAMPDGGKLHIAVAADPGGRVTVRFRDNGSGLVFDNIDDIFLPFVSSKSGDTPNQGLGLSIVHGLVKKWNGTIQVERSDPGTVFSVSFPVCTDQ